MTRPSRVAQVEEQKKDLPKTVSGTKEIDGRRLLPRPRPPHRVLGGEKDFTKSRAVRDAMSCAPVLGDTRRMVSVNICYRASCLGDCAGLLVYAFIDRPAAVSAVVGIVSIFPALLRCRSPTKAATTGTRNCGTLGEVINRRLLVNHGHSFGA